MENYKTSSNKSFGIVFFIVFLIISVYPLINDGDIRLWSLFISLIFLILGLINSKILTPLNKFWFKFGIFLGKIISPIIMGIILYTYHFNISMIEILILVPLTSQFFHYYVDAFIWRFSVKEIRENIGSRLFAS